jgi:DNA repair photolyase
MSGGVLLIISASRRTDIPAFYAQWFINRIRAGYCTISNPYNREQFTHVSLQPEDVDIIVFWTRDPQLLMPYLKELDQLGYIYYFQFTVLNNPRLIDTGTPSLSTSLKIFKKLSDLIGPERVIWRYDPIVISNITGIEFHINTYKNIAEALKNYTQRSVVSLLDMYSKLNKRFKRLKDNGIEILDCNEKFDQRYGEFMNSLAHIANKNGMEIVSCAESLDLTKYNIRPGKCIDDDYIERVFGISVTHKKDPFQRKACGCVVSKDIGVYNTCLFGCQYCYATSSFEKAKVLYENHNPDSTSMVDYGD